MKNKKILLILLLIGVLLVFCSCQVNTIKADPQVIQISVSGITNTVYVASDKIDLTDTKLLVRYDDGSSETVDLIEDYLNPSSYDMNKPGEYDVLVEYKGKSTSFKITIESWELSSITLGSNPYVYQYVVGQDVKTEGATILCQFEDNKQKTYNLDANMLQTYDKNKIGKQTIYATFHGTTLQFEVEYIDKTAKKVEIIKDAAENFVFVGKGDKYSIEGMTIRISYDNSETPVENAVGYKDDLTVYIDDSISGTKTGVLLYEPEQYPEEFTYTFYGNSYVNVGDIVTPDTAISSNNITRNGKTISLDDVISKSYGRVTELSKNSNGSWTLKVSRKVQYNQCTAIYVKPGDIIQDNIVIGRRGSDSISSKGGGIVESTHNGQIVVNTFPTTTFTTNVRNKSYKSMELTIFPEPETYKNTTISSMIEGDTIDRNTGLVTVYYDDDSSANFKLSDSANIQIINSDAISVNDALDISKPGRYELFICYAGVKDHHISLMVNVESKYPISLEINTVTNTIENRTFYYGDTISINTMTYRVKFNNDSYSEYSQITEDMIADGYSLICPTKKGDNIIRFKLPDKYESIIPPEADEVTPVDVKFNAQPQPITSAQFLTKPSDVYVDSAIGIGFEDTEISLSYRNGNVVTIKESAKKDLFNAAATGVLNEIASWDVMQDRIDELATEVTSEKVYLFVLSSDSVQLSIDDILDGKYYVAKIVYFDEYLTYSQPISFRYYILNSSNLVDKITFYGEVDPNGANVYKTQYTQYEDWDLTGMYLNVSYKNSALTARIPIEPYMIYKGSTNQVKNSVNVGFSYLGAKTNENDFVINVGERKPTKINILTTGKDLYYNNDITGINFSNYMVSLSYNAGPDIQISGLTFVPNREAKSGWWYKMYNDSGREINSVYGIVGRVIFVLNYSYADSNSVKGYSYISTPSFEVVKNGIANLDENMVNEYTYYTVVVNRSDDNENKITSIKYEPNKSVLDRKINSVYYNEVEDKTYLNAHSDIQTTFGKANTPVLCEVANGWSLMLSEYNDGLVSDKYITVNYANGREGYVKIDNSMVSYDRKEKSTGYRKATITYRTFSCEVYIYVWEAELNAVNVFIEPKTDYIFSSINSEDDLDLESGIVELKFRRFVSGIPIGYMYKYLDMTNSSLAYSGFKKNQYSKDGTEISITVQFEEYSDLTDTFTIKVYERQQLDLSFNNTIFFYGGATAAEYVINDYIYAFSLPNVDMGTGEITLKYCEFNDLITIFEYASLSEANKKDYISVTIKDKDSELAQVMYIRKSDLVNDNYIDPVSGIYYIEYGTIAYLTQDRYALVSDDCKELFSGIKNYDFTGKETDMTYFVDYDTLSADEKLILAQAGNKEYIKIFHDVPISKILKEEYLSLAVAEKDLYEEESNSYYIVVVAVDSREDAKRYYYSTAYALNTFSIIQKVISVSTLSPKLTTAHYITVSTSLANDNSHSSTGGNPYAILYLLRPDRLRPIYQASSYYTDPNQTCISEIYITSPNVTSFEIMILLNNNYVTDESNPLHDIQDTLIAGVMRDILYALTTDAFISKMGVTLEEINFNALGTKKTISNDANSDIAGIKDSWTIGVNKFTNEQIENDEYHINYLINYGELLTRNGVLQLLDGRLEYVDDDNNGEYEIDVGSLNHTSYKIDLTIQE
ncbi:MAG: bacterial Ig-like domain-containing protein [Clostridia bacterium]|nr:bacterial Ig-like domain-containing protein [Clostridia bacterium]